MNNIVKNDSQEVHFNSAKYPNQQVYVCILLICETILFLGAQRKHCRSQGSTEYDQTSEQKRRVSEYITGICT